METLKILIVSEYYPPKVFGGGEKSVQMLAESLARAGHSVSVLTSHHPGLKKEENQKGVDIYRWIFTGPDNTTLWHNFLRTIPFHFSTQQALKNWLKSHPVDIVHVFNVTAIVGVVNGLVLKRPRPRLTATLNCHNAFCPLGTRLDPQGRVFEGIYTFRIFWKFYRNDRQIGKLKNHWWIRYNLPLALYIYWNFGRTRRAMKQADHLCAVSESVKRIADQHVASKKVSVVHNIVDFQGLSQTVEEKSLKSLQKHHNLKNKKALLYLGALTAIKGVDVFMDALSEVVQSHPEVVAIIGGEGPDRSYLEKIVRKNHLEKHVLWAGMIPAEKVAAYYHVADVFVQPSRIPEPLSRTLLEAAFLNRPIVASKVGGSLDVIRNGKNGYLVPSESVQAFAAAIEKILAGTLDAKILQRTNQDVLKRFEGEYVVHQMETLFYETLASH